MKLQVQPLTVLVDQKINICISELTPFSKVKVSVSMCLPWAKDVLYESFAWFTADATGNVDLSRQKTDSGTYDSIDSMGLIVSMKSKDPKAMEKIAQSISVSESLFINILVESGQEGASATMERLFKTPEIKTQRITDEFVGELFYSDDPNRKTIVWLGGSGSGLGVNSLVCAPLASRSFNVLSIPFFGKKGLPAQLSRIPLEYFEKVFAWLSKNPITSGKEIWILGMSKGAELALVLASRYPFITRVALWAPHAYCFQGIAFKNESSWTYAGKDLPYIQLRNGWVFTNMLNGFIKNEPFEFASVYKKGIAVANSKEAARIKVEDAQSLCCLFSRVQRAKYENTRANSLRSKFQRGKMNKKTSINLGKVQKTLFLPMWGRAVESKKEKPLLFDKAARAIMDEIDYDFGTIAENISEISQIAWIMRSIHVDDVVKAFLTRFPGGTVVNVGCGMDTTFDRVDNGTLLWYDLDLPDVIELRRQFILENERRKFISCSFLDEDWLREIRVDQTMLFIVAGVFYYFEESDVRGFLTRMADLFPGSEVIFDVSSPYGVRVANKLVITKSGLDERSFLKWGLEHPQTLLAWDKRFQLLHTYYYFGKNARSLTLKNKLLGMFSDFLRIQYMVYLRLN